MPAPVQKKRRFYPNHSEGTELGAKIRQKANQLTAPEREEFFEKGMVIIYDRKRSKEATRPRL